VSFPDRFVAESDRPPNEVERTYTAIAAGSGDPSPCERISPRAVRMEEAAERGLQVILERSLCFERAARTSGKSDLCSRVESASTRWLDGSDFDAERCRQPATGGPADALEPPSIELLMGLLGFAPDELAERCDDFLRTRRVASLEAEQDAYVRCVQERPAWLRDHPDRAPPICTGPFNRVERYEDCVKQRVAAVEREPGAFPDDRVDRCRLFLRRATLEQRRYDLCVDEQNLQRHRDPGPRSSSAEQVCRRRTLEQMRRELDWGDYGFCRSLVEADADTFQWRVAPASLRDGPDWAAIYSEMLRTGEVLARLDRLPNHAVD
jgi:hypothetical protein